MSCSSSVSTPLQSNTAPGSSECEGRTEDLTLAELHALGRQQDVPVDGRRGIQHVPDPDDVFRLHTGVQLL